MKHLRSAVILLACLLSGCVSSGPAISKSSMGSLDIHVTAPEGVDPHAARVRIDGRFVGNVSRDLPVLYLKRGRHTVTVNIPGLKPYEEEIEILGEPNHQFLEVRLGRE